ncbi:MAG: XRE family transcriptional regulator, partial [Crocinitomicaceae bacterium]|nr:XRE family transcriptional regulator [Crocinitomicaceae bacterium]
KKITLDKIYKETGIHLARIESKNHNITLSTLKKLCDYLEIDAFDFLSKLVRA